LPVPPGDLPQGIAREPSTGGRQRLPFHRRAFVDLCPGGLSFQELDRRVDWQVLKSLPQPARPANLQSIHRLDTGQSEMLFERKAAEVTSAADFAELALAARFDLNPRADCRAVAPPALQPNIEVVSRQGRGTEDPHRQQVSRIRAARGNQDRKTTVAEQVCQARAVSFAVKRKPRCEGCVAESLSI